MVQVIRQSTHVARKKHYDNGIDYIIDSYESLLEDKEVSEEDKETLRKWKADPNNHIIMPGMTYVCQFNKQDGEVYTFKMRKELYDIACKYKLWELYE